MMDKFTCALLLHCDFHGTLTVKAVIFGPTFWANMQLLCFHLVVPVHLKLVQPSPSKVG